MPDRPYEEETAGQPAVGLFAHAIASVAQLDAFRRQLAGDNEDLARLLLGIEETSLRQAYDHVQEGAQPWVTKSHTPSASSSTSSSRASTYSSNAAETCTDASGCPHESASSRHSKKPPTRWTTSLTGRASAWRKRRDDATLENTTSATASGPGAAGEDGDQPSGPVVPGEVVE